MENQEYLNLLSENNVLKCKLESKAEAVVILTRELEVCRSERDQFKLMAEQLRDRYNTLKKRVEGWGPSLTSVYDVQGFKRKGEQNLAQLLCELKDQNKLLKAEVTDLRQKLNDAKGDVKLLRDQLAQGHTENADENCELSLSLRKQDLVKELETMRHKYSLLERDLQSILDEKEELVVARDAYMHKVERLNKQLNKMLHGKEHIVDIDAVIMENRYLQERVKQLQEEKAMVTATLSKYKNILEKKRSRGNIRLNSASGNLVITNKQVQQLLQSNSFLQIPDTPNAVADLQSLVVALYEALNDKSLALAHQKKANKLLGNRLTELEKKVKMMEASASWTHYETRNLSSCLSEITAEADEFQCINAGVGDVSDASDAELQTKHAKDHENNNLDNSKECFSSHAYSSATNNETYATILKTRKAAEFQENNNLGDLDLLPTRETQPDDVVVNTTKPQDDENPSQLTAKLFMNLSISEGNQHSSPSTLPCEEQGTIAQVSAVSKASFATTRADSAYDEEHSGYGSDDEELPPHLQKLLDKALQEIEEASASKLDNTSSDSAVPCAS